MIINEKTTIRNATVGDAKHLARLVTEFSRSEEKVIDCTDPQVVVDWIEKYPFLEIFVAENEDGEITGYVAFYRAFSFFKLGPILLVENLYIMPSERNSGLGRRLMGAVAAEAIKRNWSRIELNVREKNKEADSFYRKLGFSSPGESVRRIDDEELSILAKAYV